MLLSAAAPAHAVTLLPSSCVAWLVRGIKGVDQKFDDWQFRRQHPGALLPREFDALRGQIESERTRVIGAFETQGSSPFKTILALREIEILLPRLAETSAVNDPASIEWVRRSDASIRLNAYRFYLLELFFIPDQQDALYAHPADLIRRAALALSRVEGALDFKVAPRAPDWIQLPIAVDQVLYAKALYAQKRR